MFWSQETDLSLAEDAEFSAIIEKDAGETPSLTARITTHDVSRSGVISRDWVRNTSPASKRQDLHEKKCVIRDLGITNGITEHK